MHPSGSAIDRTTTLCLACSSSLPPSTTSTAIYITKCCQRPICPSCISSNPRLTRYDPCLFCLGGVDLVGMNGSSSSQSHRFMNILIPANANINGEVRDQDTFILGDDDDDDDDDDEENEEENLKISAGDGAASISSPPPLYESIVDPWKEEESPPHETTIPTSNAISQPSSSKPDNTRPYRYHINRSDTLQGLSLRFGIDVSAII
jgi:hypothetical protein